MIENNERIQSMLNNILEQVTIIKNDFNINVINQVIEKMESKSEKDGK